MIDALIKRVSVTYKCYEMYAHRGKSHRFIISLQANNLTSLSRNATELTSDR
jgi:hypothetical protein